MKREINGILNLWKEHEPTKVQVFPRVCLHYRNFEGTSQNFKPRMRKDPNKLTTFYFTTMSTSAVSSFRAEWRHLLQGNLHFLQINLLR